RAAPARRRADRAGDADVPLRLSTNRRHAWTTCSQRGRQLSEITTQPPGTSHATPPGMTTNKTKKLKVSRETMRLLGARELGVVRGRSLQAVCYKSVATAAACCPPTNTN